MRQPKFLHQSRDNLTFGAVAEVVQFQKARAISGGQIEAFGMTRKPVAYGGVAVRQRAVQVEENRLHVLRLSQQKNPHYAGGGQKSHGGVQVNSVLTEAPVWMLAMALANSGATSSTASLPPAASSFSWGTSTVLQLATWVTSSAAMR